MKKSKVKTVWSLNESFEAHGKKFNKWGVLFENNDSGVFNVVEGYDPRFKMGEDADYTLTQDGDRPAKIKYETPDFNKGSGGGGSPARNQDSIIWQSCFKAVCSYNAQSSVQFDIVLEQTDQAFMHCKALTEDSKEAQTSVPPEAPAFGPPVINIPQDDDDKLPF